MLFPFLNHIYHEHRGKLFGCLVGVLIFGFWGACIGFLAGAAFDKWESFLSNLETVDVQKNLPPETALLTAIVILAKAYELPMLSNAAAAIATLRKSFVIEETALRYIGRTINQHHFDKGAVEFAIAQLQTLSSGKIEKSHKVLSCLIDLAKDGFDHIDKASMEAIAGLGSRLGVGDAEFTALSTIKGFLPDAIYDPYQVLGLPTGASLDAAQRAYRRLMQEYHPDRWQDKHAVALARAQERSVLINEAYTKIKKSCAA